jgi:hypothetical protein
MKGLANLHNALVKIHHTLKPHLLYQPENQCIPRKTELKANLTVSKVRTLSNLDNITIRIADIAADLAILRDRRRDKLRTPALP